MKFKTFFKSLAVVFIALIPLASCTGEIDVPEPDYLKVEPTTPITFEARGNSAIVLNIDTNVKDWEVKAPSWVEFEKGDATLTLNASDNTLTKARLGRLEISAGSADVVKINLKQNANQDDSNEDVFGPEAKVVAATDQFYGFDKDGHLTLRVKLTTKNPAKQEMVANVIIDSEYLEEYKYNTKRNCVLLPSSAMDMGDAQLVIPAGKVESNELEIHCTAVENMEYGLGQLVPVMVKPVANISFGKNENRANFYIVKKNNKEVKNVVYYEVNDTNPLNTLCYELEDGTPFIDAIILFAANIKWDNRNKTVYLHCNPNVQALLDETETYIQPLREKGIKVYLGLLGDHDEAGLCNLTDWGAATWAQEVAEACRIYKLDGVNLDDEYAPEKTPYNKDWFTTNGIKAGSRLCYELKKALARECTWPTEVSYFAYGKLWGCEPVVDNETGIEHDPVDFIDFFVGNYGATTEPYRGLTRKNCCGASIELNLGLGGIDKEMAARIKKSGYGWIMWFAFDPCPNSHIANIGGAHRMFDETAQGLYGQRLRKPEGYYQKLVGSGNFDPKFYPYN